jgi:hypothetical protein
MRGVHVEDVPLHEPLEHPGRGRVRPLPEADGEHAREALVAGLVMCLPVHLREPRRDERHAVVELALEDRVDSIDPVGPIPTFRRGTTSSAIPSAVGRIF